MSLTDKLGASAKPGQGVAGGVGTVVGEETKIEGKLISKGNLRIDGEVEGEIFADDTVVIGPGGRINGNIEARVILVGGSVTGNVRSSEKVEIQPQGNVQGDVYTPYGRLIIEEGARLEGKCAMTKDVRLSKESKEPKIVDASSKSQEQKKAEEGA